MLKNAWYPIARAALFRLAPETAHDTALAALARAHRLGLTKLGRPCVKAKPVQALGLAFPNRVGLAAGLDKNGDYVNALGDLGFGFIEIGTVTPKPQPGNPKPRMFRLTEANAIINRLGFNNLGVDHLVRQLENRRFTGVLGINIGKNKDTPEAEAASDYVACLKKVYPYADYITVNISSPNTQGLRNLQSPQQLRGLLDHIFDCHSQLAAHHGEDKPIVLKVAPDLSEEDVHGIAQCLNQSPVAGVIATNTTIARPDVSGLPHAQETGGLSGAPLLESSTQILSQLRASLNDDIALVGLGGILSADDARQKRTAGADLVQIYTGFIYRGPALIDELLRELST